MIVPFAKAVLFAHAGEDVVTDTEAASGLLDTLAHQPAWLALTISLFVLVGWFAIMSLFRVKLITRLLAILPVTLGLTIVFFTHNEVVASVLLSGGFVLVFGVAFTLLRAGH